MKIDESLNNVMMKIDENNVTKYQRESVLFAGEKINIEMHFDRIDEDPCINCCYRKICCYRMYFKIIDEMISAEINCDDGYRPIGEYIFPENPLDFDYVENEITDFLDNLIRCSGNDDYKINQLLVFFQVLYEDMKNIRENEH